MGCQGVDTFLAGVSGGGGWGPTLIPTGDEAEDSAGSGSACLPRMEGASMDRYPTIPMDPMDLPPIHIKNSKF